MKSSRRTAFVLLDAARAGLLHLFQRQVERLEAVVVLGDGKGTVVAGGLQVGEEGFFLRQRAEDARAFLEEIQVGDAPYVHLWRLPVTLLIELHVVDALADQRIDIGPAGVATDHVELLIAVERIDQRTLAGDQRVARGGLLARDVGDTGDARPHRLGGAGDRHVEVSEEPTLLGQAIQVRRRVKWVAVGTHGAGAEGFEHDEYHVGLALGLDAVGLHWLVTKEVQPLPISVR